MARLLSVNAGRPQPVGVWRGRTVTSAIGKAPVDGRVRVEGVNLVGDDQADRHVIGERWRARDGRARGLRRTAPALPPTFSDWTRERSA
jgi:hypothetical protein